MEITLENRNEMKWNDAYDAKFKTSEHRNQMKWNNAYDAKFNTIKNRKKTI